ncbi:hypothetical protein EBR43_09910, partial [bacterium]|nr:hypothetical protein [bacterium]
GQLSLKKLNEPFKITLKDRAKSVDLTPQESLLIQSLKLMAPYGFASEKEKILLASNSLRLRDISIA